MYESVARFLRTLVTPLDYDDKKDFVASLGYLAEMVTAWVKQHLEPSPFVADFLEVMSRLIS